ncbi:MAG: c-type cytochrome [Xanthobacteraceae bacterium]
MRKSVLAVALLGLTVLPTAAQTVQARLPVCLACHGQNGQSENPGVPSLGAQQAFYVTVQLLMFRERMRVVDPMNEMAKGLSDDDLRGFADAIAKLPAPKPADGPVDSARMERARALAEKNHCNVCHTPNFGGQENVPRIADQREDYLVKALRGYKDNSRRGYDAAMADVVPEITDEQILDLAYYLARVK